MIFQIMVEYYKLLHNLSSSKSMTAGKVVRRKGLLMGSACFSPEHLIAFKTPAKNRKVSAQQCPPHKPHSAPE